MLSVVTKKLECIGEDGRWPRNYCSGRKRAWIAEIKGYQKGQLIREFLKGYKDYTESNGVGSRGVYKFFYLEEGHIYQVSDPVSWKNTEVYFCRIEDGKEVIISKIGVISFFQNQKATSPQQHKRIDRYSGKDMKEEEYWEWLRKGI